MTNVDTTTLPENTDVSQKQSEIETQEVKAVVVTDDITVKQRSPYAPEGMEIKKVKYDQLLGNEDGKKIGEE